MMPAYFVFFFSMVIISSFINCGIFEITRGYEEIMPDGEIRRYGKIFMNWYFYWFQKIKGEENKLVYYSGKQLNELCAKMNANPTGSQYSLRVSATETRIFANKTILPKLAYFKDVFDCYYLIDEADAEIVALMPFKMYPNYRFPWWIREPLAGCITCFASIYSSTWWLFIHLISYRMHLMYQIYGWADHMALAFIGSWIAYCFSCAFLGTYLYRKM